MDGKALRRTQAYLLRPTHDAGVQFAMYDRTRPVVWSAVGR